MVSKDTLPAILRSLDFASADEATIEDGRVTYQ